MCDRCLPEWIDDGACDELCNTPECRLDVADCDLNATECYTHDASDYRGSVNQTASGEACLKWSRFGYAQSGLGGHNACRNPDGKRTAWCFTDIRRRTWDYCDLGPASDRPCAPVEHLAPCAPGCTKDKLLNDACDAACDTAECNFDNNQCDDTECFSDPRAADYRGTLFKTNSGRTCQNWNAHYPHVHMFEGVGNHNFCRNPDNYSTAWCFTRDYSVRWEECRQVDLYRQPNCTRIVHCPKRCVNRVSNGACDAECDTAQCLWDGGDCDDLFLQLGARLNVDASVLHRASRQTYRAMEGRWYFAGGVCLGAVLVCWATKRIRRHYAEVVVHGPEEPSGAP